MRAYELTGFGGPEVLRLGERRDPVPGDHDVVVDVRAVGLNPIDILQRSGTFRFASPVRFPVVPGNEFSGVVSAVGSQVNTLAVGDAVVGRTNKARLGALAEKVAIEADLVAPMPHTLDFTAAAAVPLAGTTALQAVRDALAIQADDRLLITGGSGMVGMFATTLAARTGAHVVATASASSEPLLRSLGAAEVIDYRSRRIDATHGPFTRVLDLVGGPQLTALLELVSPGGRLVTITATPTPDRSGTTTRCPRGVPPPLRRPCGSPRSDLGGAHTHAPSPTGSCPCAPADTTYTNWAGSSTPAPYP